MTTKLKAIIIDDEPLACSLLQFMLQQSDNIELIHVSYSPHDAIERIDTLQPDLIFLDIQMPQITGIELLELIEHKPYVVFTTAYNEHALKAFELNAIDYLLKPYTQERLMKAIEKVKNQYSAKREKVYDHISELHSEPKERIIVKDKRKMKIIPFKEIIYLEGALDYVKIYTNEGFYIKHGTMQTFEDMLKSAGFIRCHRSYIVNTHFIQSIENDNQKYQIFLQNKTTIPVSRNRQQDVKDFLLR